MIRPYARPVRKTGLAGLPPPVGLGGLDLPLAGFAHPSRVKESLRPFDIDFDHGLRGLRGLNRWTRDTASYLRVRLSIHPKHKAISTASLYEIPVSGAFLLSSRSQTSDSAS